MDTEYQNIVTETDGELLIATLNWPERLNALSRQMRGDLLDCVRRAEKEETIRAIVLTGHGERAFSAGRIFRNWKKGI